MKELVILPEDTIYFYGQNPVKNGKHYYFGVTIESIEIGENIKLRFTDETEIWTDNITVHKFAIETKMGEKRVFYGR